ncbi:cytochrome P450 [Thelephora ganbajun]|uniref:Cytochrome P450 n=1 Tax=Thelephora ganbajun TaxID=370292 RepID=A0ACB6Z9K1_THEGA|nr:cytochrome P450 [Thelephora ganbajun]
MDLESWKEPKVILASVLLLVTARAVYKKKQITRRPPVVYYAVPWVGSAIDLGKSPDAFFKRAIAKYGDIFTVKAFGRTITYITSPQLIAEVYKNPQKYDFPQIRENVGAEVFMISENLAHAPFMQETLFPLNHKLLSQKHVQPIVDKCIALIYQDLKERANQYDGLNIALRDFIVPLTFDASGHAFFGKDFPVNEFLEPFKSFDDNFHLLLAGVPKIFMRGPVNALDRLVTIIEEKYLSKPHALDDAFDLIKEYERLTKESGFNTRDVARLIVTFLWALQTNAPLAPYWIIALNLQRPDGLEPLVTEVDEAVISWNTANPTLPLDSHQNVVDFINQTDLPLLNSTIQETLRFTTSVMSIRTVMDTTELGGYTFNRGDEVVCSIRTVHLDPEIHEQPNEYIPTRYMTHRKFTKNGKPVTNHTMPFGGGVSMCEGRHFAQKELKALLALLLMKYTIEVDPKSTERPVFLEERMGVGLMHPKGDIRVIIHTRE